MLCFCLQENLFSCGHCVFQWMSRIVFVSQEWRITVCYFYRVYTFNKVCYSKINFVKCVKLPIALCTCIKLKLLYKGCTVLVLSEKITPYKGSALSSCEDYKSGLHCLLCCRFAHLSGGRILSAVHSYHLYSIEFCWFVIKVLSHLRWFTSRYLCIIILAVHLVCTTVYYILCSYKHLYMSG